MSSTISFCPERCDGELTVTMGEKGFEEVCAPEGTARKLQESNVVPAFDHMHRVGREYTERVNNAISQLLKELKDMNKTAEWMHQTYGATIGIREGDEGKWYPKVFLQRAEHIVNFIRVGKREEQTNTNTGKSPFQLWRQYLEIFSEGPREMMTALNLMYKDLYDAVLKDLEANNQLLGSSQRAYAVLIQGKLRAIVNHPSPKKWKMLCRLLGGWTSNAKTSKDLNAQVDELYNVVNQATFEELSETKTGDVFDVKVSKLEAPSFGDDKGFDENCKAGDGDDDDAAGGEEETKGSGSSVVGGGAGSAAGAVVGGGSGDDNNDASGGGNDDDNNDASGGGNDDDDGAGVGGGGGDGSDGNGGASASSSGPRAASSTPSQGLRGDGGGPRAPSPTPLPTGFLGFG